PAHLRPRASGGAAGMDGGPASGSAGRADRSGSAGWHTSAVSARHQGGSGVRLLAALLSSVAAAGLAAAALGMLPRVRSRRRRRRGYSEWLTQAGVSTTPVQFWATSVAAGFVTLVAVTLLTGSWAVAAVPS